MPSELERGSLSDAASKLFVLTPEGRGAFANRLENLASVLRNHRTIDEGAVSTNEEFWIYQSLSGMFDFLYQGGS